MSAFGHSAASPLTGPHTHLMIRFAVSALGVLMVLVGAVWTLQGANLLGGSFMTGSRQWLVIGFVLLVAGAAVLIRSIRTRH